MATLLNSGRFLRLSLSSTNLRFYCCNTDKVGLVLGAYTGRNKQFKLTSAAEQFDSRTQGKLSESIKLVEDKLKAGKSFVFWNLHDKYNAVAVVGLGEEDECSSLELMDLQKESVRIAASAGCRALQDVGVKKIYVDEMRDYEAAAEGSALGLWKFQELKTKQEYPPEIDLYAPCEPTKHEQNQWNSGIIKAEAQNKARWLMDMPSNIMTPSTFANEVCNMFNDMQDVCVTVHDKKWAEKMRMNAFLSVTQGSEEPPVFLEVTYSKLKGGVPPYIIIGKGVTFDSGGISIKPSASMDEMRADMGGAATGISALYGITCLNTQANVKVLIPLCENMPSGKATKPGDIIKAMNGKSICVNNTDAEGRLILADALCYAAKFKPKWIADIATLTGAMRIALGNAATGVFSNSDDLYEYLEKASYKSGDRVWRFPLWKKYTKEITSDPAYDVNNIGKGGGGGSCTAAAFLKEFVPVETDWLHLDIAGVMGPNSDIPYLHKGMSGRPTRTLIEFVDLYARLKQ